MLYDSRMSQVRTFWDRGYVLKNGRVAMEAEAKELIEREDVFKLL